MTFTAEKLPDSKIKLVVNLDKKDLLSCVEEAEKRLARNVKLGGFRPGKAPKDMVRKAVGEEKIREEALQMAVQSSLTKVMADEKLDVLDRVSFEIKENSPEKLVYWATFLIFPELVLGEYEGLGIKRNAVVVSDAEVKKVLDEVLKSRTVFNEIKRPAQIGDRVEVDFTIKDNGTIIEGGKSENHPVILGDGKFVPGFEEQIVGMEKGGTKHFSLKIPADYYQKTIAGKELDFEVAVKRVEDKIVPKLDDEFVKSLGNFHSLKELEASVNQGLTLEKETKEKDRVRVAILEKIAATTEVKVPPELIENRLDAMLRDLDNELHQKGMELGLYLAHIKKTQDELRREWRPKAELQAKMGLIARTIAKKEKLSVGEEGVNQELQIVLQQYIMSGQGGAGPEALQNIDPEGLKSKIRDTLLNEKVFEFLEKKNVIA